MSEHFPSQRDTQFQGFAKALVEEMCNQTQGGWIDFDIYDQEEVEKYSLVVARRAYDLMRHVIGYLNSYEYDVATCEQHLIDCIPDMTMFPKDNNNDERRDTTGDGRGTQGSHS